MHTDSQVVPGWNCGGWQQAEEERLAKITHGQDHGSKMKRDTPESCKADIAEALAAAENEGWPLPKHEGDRHLRKHHLTAFMFCYPHENTECQLSTRNVDARVFFYFAICGAGRIAGREDIALTTQVSVPRIIRTDLVEPQALAAELLLEIYSHGEPQRRKPSTEDRDLLLQSLIMWICENRRGPMAQWPVSGAANITPVRRG